MLGFRPNIYWRICWKYVTPGLMTVILVYTLLNLEPLKDGDHDYPPIAYVIGWCITGLGLIQLPAFAIYAIWKQEEETFLEVRIPSYLSFENLSDENISESQSRISSNCKMGATRRGDEPKIPAIHFVCRLISFCKPHISNN